MDNASLIEKCSAGSKEAMESLYCRYSGRMMKLIHRYVSDGKGVEDILHDGFVLIFTHISEVRQPEKLEFWMGTIMKNLCLNYLSNLDVMTILDEDVELPEVPDLEDILSYEELEQLINKLPDGYRTVFKLAVFEGKSHKEIGRLLGISPNTSSSQLFHAKALLRKLIIERRKEVGLILLSLFIALGVFVAHYRSILPEDRLEMAVLPTQESLGEPAEVLSEPEIQSVVAAAKPTMSKTVAVQALAVSADTIVEEPVAETHEPEEVVALSSDTILEPKSKEPRQASHFDIPRKAMASGGWKIGAHYSAGAQMPSEGLDYMSYPMASPSDRDFLKQDTEPYPLPAPTLYNEIDYDIPITFGISVAKKLSSRISVETGLNYTYMRATIKYTSLRVNRTIKSHFVGIPLKFNCYIYSRSRFSFYATAGATVDFPAGKQEKLPKVSAQFPVELPELESKPEISVHGGLGLQYSITPAIGCFVEPSVQHYFKNGSTSPSYWQENRTLITIPIGLKITF